ncbi:hypothetical protein B0A52_01030 [Exophiala mesophila]|uniref:FAD-binding domain-containing protein n=1 Tax=Exophiala mesophila TaxID=212818 RepID=A0A438NG97_EXOME|nr:hypothetical protein B0A52_01030 [Exophiala mesophila]
MDIVVVGAGLGGLAAALAVRTASAAHKVLVLEAASKLTEVRSALKIVIPGFIMVAAHSRGVHIDTLKNLATRPQVFTISRYTGAKVLGRRDGFDREMLSKYGSPFCDIHRADLQLAMFERAKELGVQFMFNATVSQYDFESPSVTLLDGTRIEGDLIVAADGLWSKARSEFLATNDPPFPTGDLAYRIVLNTDMIIDQDMKEFVSKPRVHLWAGPQCHAIYYPLRNNTMINIVLLVPDNLPENVAKASGDLEEMKELFRDWDPFHPMLPYMAQGANSALEDGAVLGGILSKVQSKSELSSALKIYQDLRKPRSWAMVKGSLKQRYWNHLPDGPEQEDRDKLLQEQFDEPQPGYPFYWLDPSLQSTVYSYDADEEVKAAWGRYSQKL